MHTFVWECMHPLCWLHCSHAGKEHGSENDPYCHVGKQFNYWTELNILGHHDNERIDWLTLHFPLSIMFNPWTVIFLCYMLNCSCPSRSFKWKYCPYLAFAIRSSDVWFEHFCGFTNNWRLELWLNGCTPLFAGLDARVHIIVAPLTVSRLTMFAGQSAY